MSEEWTAIARRYWERAGRRRPDRAPRSRPAVDTLRALPAERVLDFAFIDADKAGYPAYFEEIVPRLRPGGLMVLDNMLRDGRVLDPQNDDDRAIHASTRPWSPTTGSTSSCSRSATASASPASAEVDARVQHDDAPGASRLPGRVRTSRRLGSADVARPPARGRRWPAPRA